MTHLPTSSIPTRLDESQGAPFPPNASFDSASPAMYTTPGLSCPPSPSLPILTLPEPPSFSATLHVANGVSSVPNYHGQGNVYPPANLNPTSTFVAYPLLSQILHVANGFSSVPNYHGQDNVYPPASLNPTSTFVAHPSLSQYLHVANGVSSVPNYHGQGNVYPQANLNPTSTFVAHPSLSQYLHVANGFSSVPNYHGQGNIYPPANLNPTSTFVVHPSLTQFNASNYQVPNGFVFLPMNVTLSMSTQESCQPFTGMLPSDANAAFLQSEGSGSHDHTGPLTSQWALPMEAPVTVAGQQTMYQVPQSVVQVEPPKEPGSAHKQINVTFDGASSTRQLSSRREQWKDLPGVRLRVKNKTPNTCRYPRTTMDENGREQYYCDLCDNWVLLHRKKYHNKKHNGNQFVCKICEILGDPCEPLSRKDALKRHIEVQHAMFLNLLHNLSLKLLVPRRKNEPSEDLGPLFQAMIDSTS